MGAALCQLFKEKPVKVVFFGLDAVGKTTLLYKLKLGEIVTTIPTIGFNVEEVDVNGLNTLIWDVGLRNKSRPLIRHYLDNTDALVFMVDSRDEERLPEAIDEFFAYVNDAVQERQLPVVVLANKQDAERGVLSPERIKTAIFERGGKAFRENTALEVFPTVALTLEGVTPAFEWLTTQLALKMATRNYLPSLPKAVVTYPASFMKSAYQRVAGLWSSSSSSSSLSTSSSKENEEEKLQEKTKEGEEGDMKPVVAEMA